MVLHGDRYCSDELLDKYDDLINEVKEFEIGAERISRPEDNRRFKFTRKTRKTARHTANKRIAQPAEPLRESVIGEANNDTFTLEDIDKLVMDAIAHHKDYRKDRLIASANIGSFSSLQVFENNNLIKN